MALKIFEKMFFGK